MQLPQWPTAQPSFVPVSRSWSRSTSIRFACGDASTWTSLPLTVRLKVCSSFTTAYLIDGTSAPGAGVLHNTICTGFAGPLGRVQHGHLRGNHLCTAEPKWRSRMHMEYASQSIDTRFKTRGNVGRREVSDED